MKKRYRYTFLSLLLAAVFVFGSTVCMNYILHIREKQLLTESGKVVVESPVRAWQDWEKGTQEDTSGKKKEQYLLTMEQTENVIKYWNDRSGETIHDPVEGQLSMEEAIGIGEKWLVTMGVDEGKTSHSVSTTLSIGNQKGKATAQLEPYYSFWTLQFSNQTMSTVMFINAVTGQILSAKVTLYENIPEKLPDEKLKIFMKAAGLQSEETAVMEINPQETQAVLNVKDSLLYAQMGYSNISIDKNDLVDYSSNGIFHQQHVVITYDFMVYEK